jgi:hypothetical protein
MKRTPPEIDYGMSRVPVLLNFSKDQLAGIGAVAMAYNAAEKPINDMVRIGWRITFDADELLTRIGGVDGKIHLVKHAARAVGMWPELQAALAQSLGASGFEQLKKYRDGVIHARMWDYTRAVGLVVERRARVSQVLLSVPALTGLAARLECMTSELEALRTAYREFIFKMDAENDQQRELCEAEFRAAMARYEQHLNQRLSLPPLPKFPEEPPASRNWDALLEGQPDASDTDA